MQPSSAATTKHPQATTGAEPTQPSPPVVATANRLEGIVSNQASAPVAGATVTAYMTSKGSQLKSETSTGPDGKFKLENLPVSLVDLLTASAPGYERCQVAGLQLPLGDPIEMSVAELPKSQLMVSITRDNASQPTPYSGELTLFISKQASTSTSDTLGVVQAGVRSGQFQTVQKQQVRLTDGKYELKDLVPGTTYRASVLVADEYAESEPFVVKSDASAQPKVIIGLRRDFAGIVQSRDHKAIANAQASLQPSERPLAVGQAHPLAARSGQDGRFNIEDVVPGMYDLTLSANGFTTRTLAGLSIRKSAPTTPSVFLLTEGQSSLDVSVVDAEGRPVSKAALALLSSATSNPKTYFGRTDSAGNYKFTGMVAGRYVLGVTAPDNHSRQKTVNVEIADGQAARAQVAFTKLVKVTGTASVAGQPYEGLLVFGLRGEIRSKSFAKADSAGAFGIELEPGQYVAQRPGTPGNSIVDILPGDTAAIDVAFR